MASALYLESSATRNQNELTQTVKPKKMFMSMLHLSFLSSVTSPKELALYTDPCVAYAYNQRLLLWKARQSVKSDHSILVCSSNHGHRGLAALCYFKIDRDA